MIPPMGTVAFFRSAFVMLSLLAWGGTQVQACAQKSIVIYTTGSDDGYLPYFFIEHEGRKLGSISVGETKSFQVTKQIETQLTINRGYDEVRKVRIPQGPGPVGIHVSVNRSSWTARVVAWNDLPRPIQEAFPVSPSQGIQTRQQGEPGSPQATSTPAFVVEMVAALPSASRVAIVVDTLLRCGFSPSKLDAQLAKAIQSSAVLVDRTAMGLIFQEQKMQMSGLTAETEEPVGGELIGATHILSATCDGEDSECQVVVRLVEVRSGKLHYINTIDCSLLQL